MTSLSSYLFISCILDSLVSCLYAYKAIVYDYTLVRSACVTNNRLPHKIYNSMACNLLSNKIFLKRIRVLRHGMRPTYDVYDYTSGDETTNTKTAVAPELIRICPNQPCKLNFHVR